MPVSEPLSSATCADLTRVVYTRPRLGGCVILFNTHPRSGADAVCEWSSNGREVEGALLIVQRI